MHSSNAPRVMITAPGRIDKSIYLVLPSDTRLFVTVAQYGTGSVSPPLRTGSAGQLRESNTAVLCDTSTPHIDVNFPPGRCVAF